MTPIRKREATAAKRRDHHPAPVLLDGLGRIDAARLEALSQPAREILAEAARIDEVRARRGRLEEIGFEGERTLDHRLDVRGFSCPCAREREAVPERILHGHLPSPRLLLDPGPSVL